LPESTGPNDKNNFLKIAFFEGKILSKQADIPSSCGKRQGQHMEKKSGKKIQPVLLAISFRGLSFYGADCTVCLSGGGNNSCFFLTGCAIVDTFLFVFIRPEILQNS
jgi:hypothetical protein